MSALVVHCDVQPPMDGRVFIASGAITGDDGCIHYSDPFVGRVYVERGELRWSISGSSRQCVRSSLEETVRIHSWAPISQAPVRRIQEAA